MCVVNIRPSFLPVVIEHNLCTGQFFNPRDKFFSGHKTRPQRYCPVWWLAFNIIIPLIERGVSLWRSFVTTELVFLQDWRTGTDTGCCAGCRPLEKTVLCEGHTRILRRIGLQVPCKKNTLVCTRSSILLCTNNNSRFFRNNSLFLFGRGSFLVFSAARPVGGWRGQYGKCVGSDRASWHML